MSKSQVSQKAPLGTLSVNARESGRLKAAPSACLLFDLHGAELLLLTLP